MPFDYRKSKYYKKILPWLENRKVLQLLLFAEILILIVILSTLTGGKGVDWDESFTHKLVTYNDMWGIIQATAADVHPPLYYLIVKSATFLFGNTLPVYTWTSICPAIGCMLLGSTLIFKRFGFWTAGLFNFAMALAPSILGYNLYIRMYSWMAFFVLGCLLYAREALEKNCFLNWFFLFLFSICGVYTQYFAVVPIVAIYFYILLYIAMCKSWKKLIPFGIVCLLDVLAYLPWLLFVLVHQFAVSFSGNPSASEENGFLLYDFFRSGFSTNIELGELMAFILFLLSLIIFIATFKNYGREDRYFISMLIFTCIFTIYVSYLIGGMESHFFSWRYAYPVILLIWLLFSVIFARVTPLVYGFFCIWSFIICMSSYTVSHATEYDTTPLYDYTMAFTDANIAPDSIIVYDYGNFNVLYEYYLPGHEFIPFSELDLDKMKGQTFWFIQLGGSYFTEGMIEAHGLEIEHYSGFGYIGMVRFDLEKVTVTK